LQKLGHISNTLNMDSFGVSVYERSCFDTINGGNMGYVIQIGLVLCIGFSSVSQSAPIPNNWNVNLSKGAGSVEFSADVKPGFFKIHGKGGSPVGNVSEDHGVLKGEIKFSLDSLDTGIGQRNSHMKEKYLQTSKYPDAKFTIQKLELPTDFLTSTTSPHSVPFSGKLLLHGVENAVTGVATVEKKSGNVDFTTHFQIKLEDYKIETPRFAGVSVSDVIDITVKDQAPLVRNN
jgi:hypothetical protein